MTLTNVLMVGVQHPHMFTRIDYFKANANLVGFYDDDEETAAKLAAREPDVKRFTSLESALTSSPVDCVFIHGLDHDVPRYAREVMAAKPDLKGLFLEKPGAARPADFFQLSRDLQKFKNLVVEFGWEMHYSEVMQQCRELVSKDTLGEITTAHFHAGTPAGGSLEKWQCLDTTLGGFVYTDGSHTFEQVIDLFGLPERVVASVRKLPLGNESFKCVSIIEDLFGEEKFDSVYTKVGSAKWEDIGSVILEYKDKNVVLDFTAWEAKHWCNDWTIDLYGTNGIYHAFLSPPNANLYLREPKNGYVKGDNILKTLRPSGESSWMDYFRMQVEKFLERCDGSHNSQDQICGLANEMKLMKLLEAIFESAKQEKFIAIQN